MQSPPIRTNRGRGLTRRLAAIVAIATLALATAGCGPTAVDDGNGNGNGDGGTAGGGDGGGGGGCSGSQCLNNCPAGQQTTITGVVRAPNGIDPVPGALVYVPREVTEFPDGVRCEVCSQITDIAIVSTTTNADGTFTLGPIPTAAGQAPGVTVQLVAQKGRFRKLANIQIDAPCSTNAAPAAALNMPGRTNGFDSIPKIAVATGDYDVMECVLLKLGLEQSAFDIYNGIQDILGGGGTPNAVANFDVLLGDLNKMKQYNIIFINCTNNTYEDLLSNATIKSNIEQYVLSGGRLYVTDWSYDYVEQIGSFASIIDFAPDASGAAPEPVNAGAIGTGGITTEAQVLDQGLNDWLQAVEAVTGDTVFSSPGRVHIKDFLQGWVLQLSVTAADNVKVWLSGDVSGTNLSGEYPLTTTFDYQACGRVLYSSYHTEGRPTPPFGTLPDYTFPNYCSSDPLTPQERVLEYLILHIADCISID